MSQPSALEQLMLELINEERAAVGLPPLRFNGDLNEASEDHSLWMLATDTFSHTGQGGSSAGDRIVDAGYELEGNWAWGENIAWQSERGDPGLEDDVRDLHESLMQSPSHRANILSPDFDEIGIGIERGDFGRFDSVMVTQNFASSDATPEPEPAPVPAAPATPAPEPPVVTVVPAAPDLPTMQPVTGTEPAPSFSPADPRLPDLTDLFQDLFEFTPAGLDLPAVPGPVLSLFTSQLPVQPLGPVAEPFAQNADLADHFLFDGFDWAL